MMKRRLLLSKGSKVGLRSVHWRLSSIFDLGLCVLIGQSELSTLPPVPGLLIDSPGYEVDVTQLTMTAAFFNFSDSK